MPLRLALALVTFAGCSQAPPCDEGIEVGQCPPVIELPGADGRLHALAPRGRREVLLEFSTMWCLPCYVHAENTAPYRDNWERAGLDGITVLLEDANTQPPDAGDAQAWINEFGLEYPVLYDADQITEPVFDPFSGLPALFWLDRHGRVVWTHRGDEGAVEEIEARLSAQ